MGEANSEPTMEEILSSIKKIIADDSGKPRAASEPRRAQPREPSHDEFGSLRIVPKLEQTEPVALVDPATITAQNDHDDDVLDLVKIAPEEIPDIVSAEIISPVAVAASRNAFDTLSALIIKPDVHGGDTLEGMVREMLRPMLKDWLDARLPEIVEALVAKEISRISGR